MEEIVQISDEIKNTYNLYFEKGSRNENILIQNNKYKFYLHNLKNSDSLKYRCSHYKNPTKNKERCEAFFTLKNNYFTKDFNPNHTSHKYDENAIASLIDKNQIFHNLENTSNIYNVKPPELFRNNESSFKPLVNFSSLRQTIYNKVHSLKIPEPKSYEEINFSLDLFKDITQKSIILFHESELIIIQTESMAKIMANFIDRFYIDATYYSCPSMFYQLVVIRIYNNNYNSYYTTCFALMTNKTEQNYIKLLSLIK